MNLIAIETSTENCSVALLHAGNITSRDKVAPQKHAELVLGFIDELLSEQGLKKTQVEGIVFGQGPGAFTGVRIAMSVVQGLALAWEVPVIAISTMHNMAHQIWHKAPVKQQKILVANDARMGEVYWAAFEVQNESLLRLTEDALHAPEAIKTEGFDVCAGSAFYSMVKLKGDADVFADSLPNAASLIQMTQGNFKTNAQHISAIKPAYIREKVVFN
ncbi:tRNA (adenosine(37)-N6)-threonylcarbamoyltransferase complex dimerization subunit type 1 TsaB [Marinicella sp. S1101]|uniref:tRNA (adenosine(37)-N6)-threonylcarbamoyltransferase complex dimerization subunit type 1 TsaB n=1 Tax=Marinicella marina TaxID=2996016 RepID=UPI002260D7D2|nr:tRNA (adenosine(37)-N6)-threonylcarbamoyltransferase complex dimerization subunit type 1 TsaB [Marinicella marina]MCX7552469.1 tRNA (adenosine(37)-N6)-threonylcarbamoyltransferase complex dimerization subunit type 1 TsaB [Marinicella marina]MDJ1139345.1 tRNA (adenosine(37)-N6)-threonylcarbamoyltransferase complex dimerization subunit type 1 TsaB [Marinicella marina]